MSDALHEANEALEASEERFRDLFDEAPIAYVHEGLDSRFIRANQTAMRILGVKPEDVPTTYGKTFAPDTPDAQRRMREAFESIGRGTDTSGVVLEMRRKDNGKPFWIQWWSRPDPSGAYTRTMFLDITDRVLMEQEKARLEAQNIYLQEEIRSQHNFVEIVGNSRSLLAVLQQVDQVAPTEATTLIQGETGTGKELIARAIHDRSRRHGRPLVKVNCGAITAGLVESELFGHVKGAFIPLAEDGWLAVSTPEAGWRQDVNSPSFFVTRAERAVFFSWEGRTCLDGILVAGPQGRGRRGEPLIACQYRNPINFGQDLFVLNVRGKLKPELRPDRSPPDDLGRLGDQGPTWRRLRRLASHAHGFLWQKVIDAFRDESNAKALWQLPALHGVRCSSLRKGFIWSRLLIPSLTSKGALFFRNFSELNAIPFARGTPQPFAPGWARGRMNATVIMISQGAMALGGVMWGSAASLAGASYTLVGAAVLFLTSLLLASRLSINFAGNLEERVSGVLARTVEPEAVTSIALTNQLLAA